MGKCVENTGISLSQMTSTIHVRVTIKDTVIWIGLISLGHDTRVNNEKAGNMIHNSRLPCKKKIRERQTIRQKTTGQIRSIIMIKGFRFVCNQ